MKGEFGKRAQDIANHVPLGILDELHKKHNVWLPDSFLKIVEEAKQEFPDPWHKNVKDAEYYWFAKVNQWFVKWFGDVEERVG